MLKVQFKNVNDVYEEFKDAKRQDVQSLLDWIEKQPHLPKIKEIEALMALHSCYFSNEAAKKTIENFFTIRTHCPEFFANRDPSSATLRPHLETCVFSLLPGRTKEGYAVGFAKFMDRNPENFNLVEQIKLFDMCLWMWFAQTGLINGAVFIMDMRGAVIGHMKRLNWVALKKFLFYVQEALPIRLKSIHVINAIPYVDTILNMMKPLIKVDILKMIHIHPTMDTLYPYVPKEMLPKRYGGCAPDIKDLHENTKEQLLNNIDFFKEQEDLKVDESKRVGKTVTASELFGIEGTFKKLDID